MHKLLSFLLALLLPGCVFVAGAAAGAAGIAVVYDHRKIEKIIQDEEIAHNITTRISKSYTLSNNTQISVTCFNQVVLLTGEVLSQTQRMQAGRIAANTDDVKKVYNQLAIRGPVSSLTRASDTWITTKIKTEMLATKNLASGSIKVVTQNGFVYLMGTVTKAQADLAVDIARRISGVQRVVKIFTYR